MKTYCIKGELKVRSIGGRDGGPFHLGATEGEASQADRVVLRDGLGQPVLPGTSLCGVLAALARASLRAAGWGNPEHHLAFVALFGVARGAREGQGQESRLKVFDSKLAAAATLVRDRNAVNRERGSADDKRLFQEETVDGAWFFPICLELRETGPRTAEELDIPVDPDALARRLLFDVLSILEAGWANIGGSSGIGYGRISLKNCHVATWDRTVPKEVLAFARSRWVACNDAGVPIFPLRPLQEVLGGTDSLPFRSGGVGRPPERIRFRCVLRPEEPLLIKSGYTTESRPSTGSRREVQEGQQLSYPPLPQKFDVDAGFCVDACGHPYVPGSSLRGVLRSRAERAIRTVVGSRLGPDLGDRAAWNPGQAQHWGEEFSKRSNYGEGDVECLVSRVFGFSGLGGRVLVSDAIPVNPVKFEAGRKLLDHVALDRFSGGAADKRKFTSRPYFPPCPPSEAFNLGDLKCEVELHDFEPWQLGMLLLLLRDLHKGFILLGHGRNKGFGRLRLIGLEMEALSASGAVLAPAITEGALSLGGFKVVTAALCFDSAGYVRTTESLALSPIFRQAEQAMRSRLSDWQPAKTD